MTHGPDDFLTRPLAPSRQGTIPATHARLWPDTQRALCSGAVVPATLLSTVAHHDEDADVTCDACLRADRAQEVR